MSVQVKKDTIMPKELIFDRTDDEVLKILIDEEEIFTTNHDEVGWSGIEAIETYSKALALTSFTRSPPPLSFLAFTHSNKNEGGG